MEPPPLELVLNEVSRGNNKSKDVDATTTTKESPLKRAIKENENSIIQSILLLPSTSAFSTTTTNSGSSTTVVTEGVTPLLDYLFEDGQLTRVEYDHVDKACGIQSAHEQVQVLLRILMETKLVEQKYTHFNLDSQLGPLGHNLSANINVMHIIL